MFSVDYFNIINAMIRVVKMDSHRVEFFSFYRGNMVGKAETQFGLCLPYILYTTSLYYIYMLIFFGYFSVLSSAQFRLISVEHITYEGWSVLSGGIVEMEQSTLKLYHEM